MTASLKKQALKALILETIYVNKKISRIDISKITHITPSTTSLLTAELLNEKKIIELSNFKSNQEHVGRKKILLTINPSHSFYLGCEITENYFTFTIGSNTGITIAHENNDITKEAIQKEGSILFIKYLKQFLSLHQDYDIAAIGVAIPGRYNPNFQTIITDNLLWKNFNLKTIQENLPYPVFFSNNVNCMAIFQRLLTDETNNENFIFFHFKRGMHCSYMYNGNIYGRNNNIIGEIGHTVVSLEGPLCTCGKRGCLQTYLGESYLLANAVKIAQHFPNSILGAIYKEQPNLNLEHLLLAYDLGDTIVHTLLDNAMKYLAQSLFNLNILIDSKKIFLHSPLLVNKRLAKNLQDNITIEPHLLQTQISPLIEIIPYDIYTGANSAIALAVGSYLLGQPRD